MSRFAGWLGRRWLAVALVAAYLYAFPYFEKLRSANELPRIWLTQAMVDEGRFTVDTGVARYGTVVDVSEVERPVRPYSRAKGRVYSNKAPGMSLLAVPAYLGLKLAHRIFGGQPSLRELTYWFRLTASTLPALLFLWLLAFYLERVLPGDDRRMARRLALVGYALGSMALTYGTLFIAHQLAAAFAMTAFIVISLYLRGELGERWLPAAGAAAGLALLTDYQAVFFCVVPAAVLAVRAGPGWRGRVRALALAGAGAVPPVLVLLGYHQACFGSPFKTGYAFSKTFAYLHSQGFLGLTLWPSGKAFWGSFFTPDNGLFALSPIFLLALPGLYGMFRRRERLIDATVGLTALLIGAWFISSIAMWRGGWNLGPRYIAAALPFLVVPVAACLGELARADDWRRWLLPGAVGLIVLSMVNYVVLTAVYPTLPSGQFTPVFLNPLYDVGFELLGRGYGPYSLGWAVGLGGALGLVPYLAGVAAILVVVLLAAPRRRLALPGLAVGALLVGLAGLWPRNHGRHLDCDAGLIHPGEPPCIERMAAKYEPRRK